MRGVELKRIRSYKLEHLGVCLRLVLSLFQLCKTKTEVCFCLVQGLTNQLFCHVLVFF